MHEIVPVLAGPGLAHKGLGGFPHQATTLDLDLQHQRLDIAGEHDIAAAAQHEFGLFPQLAASQQSLHVGLARDPDQRMRFGHDAKAVQGV